MAISGGVREPMFSPIGRCTRAMSPGAPPSVLPSRSLGVLIGPSAFTAMVNGGRL